MMVGAARRAKHFLSFLLLCGLCILESASYAQEAVSYEGFKILQITPQTQDDVTLINALPSLDVHRGKVAKESLLEAMLSPEDFQHLRSSLPSLPFQIKVDNVQKHIDDHKRAMDAVTDRWNNKRRDTPPTEAFFDNYRTLYEYNTYIDCTYQLDLGNPLSFRVLHC